MANNPQIETLKSKLRAAGFSLEIAQQFVEPGTTRTWTRYRGNNPRGRTIFFALADLESDGYALLIEQSGIRIDDDVAALLSASAEQVPA